MGFFGFFYPWGAILQVLALIHFLRRRPEGYWFYVILFLGPLGAIAYLVMEVAPDAALLRQSFEGVSRRSRIRQLEAVVQENPAVGNFEELAGLYLDDRQYAKARDAYDHAISPRNDHPDPRYRRAIALIHLGEFGAAVEDLERVTAEDPKYDLRRAIALLAHAYANTDRPDEAEQLFRQATETSTLSETYLNYAAFLAGQGRTDEAREWVQQVLARKATMPRYLQRRERPWFRKAQSMLKNLPATTGGGR